MELDATEALRRVILGTRSSPRRSGAAGAVGLFGATGLVALVSHAVLGANPETALWLFVLLGALLAVGAAYRGGGLIASSALVLGPVYGPLTFYTWLISTREAAPVAFVLSFYGHGAPALWAPIAVALVAVSYAVGALARRIANRLRDR